MAISQITGNSIANSTITIDDLNFNPVPSNGSINVGQLDSVYSNGVGGLVLPGGANSLRPESSVSNGTIRFNSTSDTIDLYANNQWGSLSATFPGITSASWLLVAGGGGGSAGVCSNDGAGGGGGGGMITGYGSIVGGTYLVEIGAGGITNSPSVATSGGNTTFNGFTAIGGGGGGRYSTAAKAGGSGGGGGSGPNSTGGLGTPGQGNNGGNGRNNPSGTGGGGGGGGRGAIGGSSGSDSGAAGGAGSASPISGTPVTYAAGGGGGAHSGGSGGAGGSAPVGGAGSPSPGATGGNGAANRGGGGGGGFATTCPSFSVGGAGGSGICIISYVGAQTASGGTVTTSGGNTIHTFTTSGTLIV